jgi:hypothetical protein
MSNCKHKRILLVGGRDGESLRAIKCEQCGCSMTRRPDPNFPTEYVYIEMKEREKHDDGIVW